MIDLKKNNIDQSKLLFESQSNYYDVLSPVYSINSSNDNISNLSHLQPKIEIRKHPSHIVLINSKNPNINKKMAFIDK